MGSDDLQKNDDDVNGQAIETESWQKTEGDDEDVDDIEDSDKRGVHLTSKRGDDQDDNEYYYQDGNDTNKYV